MSSPPIDRLPIDYDPTDAALDVAPYDVWRRMRDEAPVYHHERLGFWALSRYDDVAMALRDTATFSSAHGNVLEFLSEQELQSGMMILTDPPAHTRLRSQVARAFTVRRTARLEGEIAAICDDLLAPWTPGEPFDLVQDFGALLPSMVMTRLLGVPEDDGEQVRTVIDTMFYALPDVGMFNDVAGAAMGELDAYLTDLLERRAALPADDQADDLLSGLLRSDLTRRECVEFAMLLATAGTETVGRLIGWAAVLLDQHPDQRALLAADPSLVPRAVEELLRFEGPSPVQGRWTKRAMTLHGVTIPAGSKVLLLTSSAGRDERAYPDADRFDVRRVIEHHVSFGYGVHFCLGAALARLESRVALTALLAHHPTWVVEHERSVRAHTSTVRGWEHVHVH
ncbi:cytochrome P450 [Nocardioides rubriscoriae]|uniref:cytochrome P450 n=1 Tax=Nocardioides rubriscoriae TaxID=642762 RepID=UPI001B8783E2|nr:cytochrome P450 [Nocardioides rubriscoriae]